MSTISNRKTPKSKIDGDGGIDAEIERVLRLAVKGGSRGRMAVMVPPADADAADPDVLFLHSPLPAYAFDRETLRFLAVNQAALAFYGYERDLLRVTGVNGATPNQAACEVVRVLASMTRKQSQRLQAPIKRCRLLSANPVNALLRSGLLPLTLVNVMGDISVSRCEGVTLGSLQVFASHLFHQRPKVDLG